MKQCDYCGKKFPPNGIRVTELVRGHVYSTSMCNNCYDDSVIHGKRLDPVLDADITIELTGDNAVDLVQTAEALMQLFDTKYPPVEPEDCGVGPCPDCGLTLRELLKLGRFGCPKCYDHYDVEFKAIAQAHQQGAQNHLGKIPKNWAQNQAETDPTKLRQHLKLLQTRAIEYENYEEAARLAEQLRNLPN